MNSKTKTSQLPTIACTSIIRMTDKNEVHGNIHIINLQANKIIKKINWSEKINYKNRGEERGLRGIVKINNKLYVASHNAINIFDENLRLVGKFTNHYLNDIHEIIHYNNKIIITSTGFDSIIEFDIETKKFIRGYSLRWWKIPKGLGRLSSLLEKKFKLPYPIIKISIFDPNKKRGPNKYDLLHINSISSDRLFYYVAGTKMNYILKLDKSNKKYKKIKTKIPFKTHNSQLLGKNKIVSNDSANNSVLMLNKNGEIMWTTSVPNYDIETLKNTTYPENFVRQGFARGMVIFKDYIIGGSSPSTISVYNIKTGIRIKSIQLTNDMRSSISGICIY